MALSVLLLGVSGIFIITAIAAIGLGPIVLLALWRQKAKWVYFLITVIGMVAALPWLYFAATVHW